jgi:hypothetical protein
MGILIYLKSNKKDEELKKLLVLFFFYLRGVEIVECGDSVNCLGSAKETKSDCI